MIVTDSQWKLKLKSSCLHVNMPNIVKHYKMLLSLNLGPILWFSKKVRLGADRSQCCLLPKCELYQITLVQVKLYFCWYPLNIRIKAQNIANFVLSWISANDLLPIWNATKHGLTTLNKTHWWEKYLSWFILQE